MAALPGTGPAFRHLIGRSGPCRPRPLEAAGARGRSGSLRSPDRARWAAELGAGRRAPDRSWAGGRPRREGGRVPARKGLEGGVRCRGFAWPRLPRAVPVLSRPLGESICQRSPLLSPPPLVGPRSAGGGRGPRRGEPISCQASGEAARGRRETHKERGEQRRRRKGRQCRDRNSRPRPLVPPPHRGWVRGRGDNAAGLGAPAPALPRPLLDGAPARPAPSRPARPPPGKGAPPRSRGGRRKSVRACRARQLASREKFAAPPRGGAARRGPPPLASAVTAGDFLDSSSARAAARTAGTAGRAGVHPRAPAPGAAGELAWGAMGLRGLGHLGLGRAFNTF